MNKVKQYAVTDLMYEFGMLKKISHCGVQFAGVKNPDSLGEHTCRAAQIGYLLAFMESENPAHVAILCLMHDIGEIRVGDAHRIASKYFDAKPAEKRAVHDQVSKLPKKIRDHLMALWNEFHDQKTRASHIARDADLLETMFQAKEYFETGYRAAERWLKNGSQFLKTRSAKKLFRQLEKRKFTDWWDHLNTV